jgi:Tol biopolymer transport system component
MKIVLFSLVSTFLVRPAIAQSSGWEVRNPVIGIVTEPVITDNSGVDYKKQFRGAEPLAPEKCDARERHLKNIRQLTFEGENAEAYFSFDEKKLVFQARGPHSGTCDQIFTMDINGQHIKRISSGKGRTTCGYWYPDGSRILYASTHEGGENCPQEPDRSKGYVWPLYTSFDIYIADTNGTEIGRLTKNTDAYDAEATISPVGDRLIYTSTQGKDIDLYAVTLDGKTTWQLTSDAGYDGGAFFSYDGKKIVYRASRPQGEALEEFRQLLSEGLVRPSALEIMVMDADGNNKAQVTNNGKANFAPFIHPDGKRIIFSSNFEDPRGREFDLYIINMDGTGIERVTYSGGFDGFPMFSRDGKTLVFCSNRNESHAGNTNIFIADWVE